MSYNKLTNFYLYKADTLISSFRYRHRKYNKQYNYLSSRKEYSEIVKEKLKGKCEFCGVKLTRTNLSVDHKLPLSRGGDTSTENLAYVCKRCNQEKAEMSSVEFIELLDLISKWNDKGQYLKKQLRAATTVFNRRRF